MDMDGNVISGGKPSIEHKFHIGIYKENPETNAVIHCHPLYCLALAVKGEDIKSCLTPEGVLLLDQVPTVRYETPGSQELVDAVMEYADAPAMLMAKHGAITQGRTRHSIGWRNSSSRHTCRSWRGMPPNFPWKKWSNSGG